MGNNDEAMSLLKKAKDMGKAMDSWEFRNNMGIAQFRAGNVKHAEECFNKARELGGDVDYNLGVVEIAKGNYDQAIALLSNYKCDYNLALAQILNRDYKAADETLACADKDADTYYLMAVNAARQNNKDKVLKYLTKAIKEDGSLKAKAMKDRSFFAFEKDPAFQALIK
jgi:tetratricopeptide (TPR) repeat protein